MTTDPPAGAELTDNALQGEIELVGDLVVAASGSEGPLSDEEIDAALGIERPSSDAGSTVSDVQASSDGGHHGGREAGQGSGSAGGHGSSRRQHV
jgi:hypothetical protein